MREILFRGKRLDNGEWAEGYYFERKDTKGSVIESVIVVDAYEQITSGQRYVRSNINRECFQVDYKTVGQFIGLTDMNGKRVFDGDIIKFHKYRYEPDWTGTVCYEHCTYMATGRMPLSYEKGINEEPLYCPFEVVISGIDKSTIKIIGNIHDNPELLEVTDNENL